MGKPGKGNTVEIVRELNGEQKTFSINISPSESPPYEGAPPPLADGLLAVLGDIPRLGLGNLGVLYEYFTELSKLDARMTPQACCIPGGQPIGLSEYAPTALDVIKECMSDAEVKPLFNNYRPPDYFKVGDEVMWNSGRVTMTCKIIKVDKVAGTVLFGSWFSALHNMPIQNPNIFKKEEWEILIRDEEYRWIWLRQAQSSLPESETDILWLETMDRYFSYLAQLESDI